jgi:hypothetical protein
MAEPIAAGELLRGAREDLARGFTVRAGTRLRQAAQTGNVEALDELSRALLNGRIPGGSREARRCLERAGAELAPSLRFLRAGLRFRGIGAANDPEGALADLIGAAQAGLAAARIELAMLWQERGDAAGQVEASAWLTGLDDACAAELLNILPSDNPMPDEPSPPDWVEAPSPASKPLHTTPRIAVHTAAFSPLECAWLMVQARSLLAPSQVFDPRTGKAHADAVRTGETMIFKPAIAGVFAHRLATRMARLAGRDPACAEPLAVLRYRPGQEYKPHHDGLGARALARDGLRAAGDRVATVLAYLNTPDAGGATVFPRLDVRIPPRAGNALDFTTLDAADEPLPLALHAGEPVAAGEKWLASLWIRARPIQL